MSESAEKIDQLIEISLSESLKNDGYKKKGHTYYLNSNGLIKVVNIQLSRWNALGFGDFTINLGVCASGAESLLRDKTMKNPKIYECTIMKRIGELMPQKNDMWWSVGPDINFEPEANKVRDAWINYGKPFLERFTNIVELKEYCLTHDMLIQVAAICAFLGEIEEARDKLKAALSKFADSDSEFNEIFYQWVTNLGFSDMLEK